MRKKYLYRLLKAGLMSMIRLFFESFKDKVVCILLDEQGNQTKEVETIAFVAYTSVIPLIIGVKNLLSNFKVCFDHANNDAYLMDEILGGRKE